MKTLLLTLATLLFVQVAQADAIRPMAAKTVELGSASGVVYYTREHEGFRVAATISTEGALPVRFVATLADGQSMIVSIPAEMGRRPRQLEISRHGDVLTADDHRPLTAQGWFD